MENRMKIVRVDALSVGKMSGVIYAVLGVIYALFLVPVMALTAAIGPGEKGTSAAFFAGFGIAMVVLIPAFSAVFGFLFGLLSSVIYNVAARWIGGVEFQTDVEAMGASYPPAYPPSQYPPQPPSYQPPPEPPAQE
jgi:hypothetical protein